MVACMMAASKPFHPAFSSFTGEMGILEPLYTTALKCRREDYRSKALAMLAYGDFVEDAWSSKAIAAIASAVAKLEEGDGT